MAIRNPYVHTVHIHMEILYPYGLWIESLICDIIGKEDIDGVPHYSVQWSATLVSKCEMEKARALIARFEAGL